MPILLRGNQKNLTKSDSYLPLTNYPVRGFIIRRKKMISSYFHRQIELLNICLDKMNLFKNNKYSKFFEDVAGIIFKEIIHEAIFADCKITIIDKFNRTYYYIRTDNVDNKLDKEIKKIIDEYSNIYEIIEEINNLGYDVPDDVIII